jgi:hypothetical protein
MAIFKELQKEYGCAVEQEVQASIGIARQDFAQ